MLAVDNLWQGLSGLIIFILIAWACIFILIAWACIRIIGGRR